MATPRVLVSSTAYDLGAVRSSLRKFIESQGFEAVLSEKSDILYDHRVHTHRSCLNEVENCDIVVLIIGSRFGSELSMDDISLLASEIDDSLLETTSLGARLSITQGEALTAVANGIPVFAFVDSGVNHDYRLFRQNRGKPFASEIQYPSISKPGTAEHIFSFIEYFRTRQTNNALIAFDSIDDILDHLQKQWAGLFKRLLSESRVQRDEAKRIDRLADQFEDLKTALLSIVGVERRQVARAAIRFRRLVAFLDGLPTSSTPVREVIMEGGDSWEDLLRSTAGITAVDPIMESYPPWLSILRRGLSEPYLCQLDAVTVDKFKAEWMDFMDLAATTREAVYDELIGTMQASDRIILSPASAEPRLYGSKEGVGDRFLGSVREREISIIRPAITFEVAEITETKEHGEVIVTADEQISEDKGEEA